MKKMSIAEKERKTKELISEYQETRRKDIAEQLLDMYSDMIQKIAWKNQFRGEHEDLLQACCERFMKCIIMYNVKNTVYFWLYLKKCLEGEMKNYNQKMMPQSSLNAPIAVGDEGVCTLEDTVEDEKDMYSEEIIDRENLAEAIETLSGDEKRILHMYFYENMTFLSISKRMHGNIHKTETVIQRILQKIKIKMSI